MDSFFTKCLVRLDSGTNIDLLRWMSRVNHSLQNEYDDRYYPLKVDCNIFMRILHVSPLSLDLSFRRAHISVAADFVIVGTCTQAVYARGDPLAGMRNQLTMVLGIWHPYKVATDKMWDSLLNVFWAPALHSIAPESLIYRKQPLRRHTVFFTQCRLAYPLFEAKLKDMFVNINRQPAEVRPHIKNLYHAFNFFIPAVHINLTLQCPASLLGLSTLAGTLPHALLVHDL
jgi:hypothetical protein